MNISEISLTPVNSGEEACDPGHFWGPGVRNNFVIHYVIEGKGKFFCDGKEYHPKAGQMFIIFPDTIVRYIADLSEPWKYSWIVFEGDGDKILQNAGICSANPIFTPKNGKKILRILREMSQLKNLSLRDKLKFTSLLYDFTAELSDNDLPIWKNENSYFSAAVNIIKAQYSKDITVEKIASEIGISRKYLFAVFKSCAGISPQNYLLDYRMKKACKLLTDLNLSIGNVAYSVGYKDPLTFSRIFKKKTGLSPAIYRKNL